MKRWVLVLGAARLCLPVHPITAQTAAPVQSAAPGRIAGKVTSEGGAPVARASVTVVGTRFGAQTDDQGRYVIAGVAPGLHRLRASMIGFLPVIVDSVPVQSGQQTPLDFKLAQSATLLEQVIVTGYGSQQRRDVTGAVGSLTSAEVTQQASTNTIDAIKGKVPGVDIVSTGYKPGDGVQVRIRGTRSIKASNDPLYVLDGVPMSGGIGDLTPSDIESIEILKDASATAIYGSRGANGVVLVTTRHGVAGRTRVTYDTYAGTEDAAKKITVFNGPEYAEYKREAYRASGDYQKYCGAQPVCDAGDKATFYAEEYSALQSGISTDWVGLISRQGAQLSNQIAVTGGNDRTQYALSGNIVREDGIILGQNYDRKSMRVNFETQANTHLRFGGSAIVLRSTQNQGRGDGLYGEALADAPLSRAFDSTGAVIFKPTPDPQRDNPLSDVANFINEVQRTRAFATMFATGTITPGLDYRISFGPDLNFQRQGIFHGAQTQVNQGTGADAELNNTRTFEYTLDNLLTYRKDIGANRFEGTALYSIERNTTDNDDTQAAGLPYETQRFWNLGSGSNVTSISSNISNWALKSYMGRANYSYRDRYLLTLTARVDGSSRLAPGKKYSTFPSVALGWRAIDDGAFGNGFGPINNLKFRASLGVTGNTSVNPYQTEGGLARTVYSFTGSGAFGYQPSTLANPDLRWEKTRQADAGIDFTMFHNRLTGTLDGYRAKTTDLIMDRKLPPNTGYTQITQNIGSTQNTGVELGLSLLTLDGWHGLRFTNDATLSVARNKILSLTYGQVNDPGNRWFIGQPITGGGNDVWYDYKMIGIWQTADSLVAKQFGQKPGEIRVQDISGPNGVPDGVINTYDLQILGNSYPKWTGSWNAHLEYQRLDFSVQTITRQGFMIQNTFRTSNSTLAGRYNGIKVDYWTPTNPTGTDPRPNKNQEAPTYDTSRAYEDGSFTRIRNITLGVMVPERFVDRFGTQSVRIYGTMQNPFTFTKSTALDPEGRTSAGTPSYKMFLLGANFGF